MGVRAWVVPPTAITSPSAPYASTAREAVVTVSRLPRELCSSSVRAAAACAGVVMSTSAMELLTLNERQNLGRKALNLLAIVGVGHQTNFLYSHRSVFGDLLGAVLRCPANRALGGRVAPLGSIKV